MGTVIAIPYLSKRKESLYRDGLGKFLVTMLSGMMEANDDVSFEIWGYRTGIAGMEELLDALIKKYPQKFHFIDDYSFFEKSNEYREKIEQGMSPAEIETTYLLHTTPKKHIIVSETFFARYRRPKKYLMANIAEHSKADAVYYFSPNIRPLFSVKKPVLVQIHDLFTMKYEKDFVRNDVRALFANRLVRMRLGILAKRGAHFVCSCNTTRDEQCMKYIPFLKEDQIHIIRFAAMVKNYGSQISMNKAEFCEKYSITPPYMCYPTQNRPNKNIITLLKALKQLKQRGVKVQLVITGCFDHVIACSKYIEENSEIKDMLVETGSLSEEGLFLLYKHADIAVSTSFIEGMCISGQILEPLQIGGIPVINTLADGIDEWLEVHGLTRETADMNWFERYDYEKLAEVIEDVLENRDAHLEKQANIYANINDPSWEETGTKYLELVQSI